MADRKRFNPRMLDALKPAKPGQRYAVPDALAPGLIVRVTDKGTKTFALVARFPDGPEDPKTGLPHPTRRKICEYHDGLEVAEKNKTIAEARETTRRWQELIRKGKDPRVEAERERLAEQRRQADVFGAVAEKLIAAELGKQRRGHVVERIIRKEVLPHWKSRPIADISHRDIQELIERVVERGAETYAHNVFDAVNAVFTFALTKNVVEANPCKRLSRKAVIGKKRYRQRVLDDAELRALWRAAGRLGYPFGPLYQLLALTGTRLDEAAGARWREFDLAAKLWTIPAERFKSEAEHIVPLSDAACAVLASLPRFQSGSYLFSASFGKTPVNGFSKAKDRLDRHMLRTLKALARARGDDPRDIKLKEFVNHDIRRTVRTRLSALKVQDHVAEMVIGHGRKGIARVYDQHKYLPEMTEALDQWAARLRSIVEPPPANVVTLKARA